MNDVGGSPFHAVLGNTFAPTDRMTAAQVTDDVRTYESLIAMARRMVPSLARYGVIILPDDLGDAVHEFWIWISAEGSFENVASESEAVSYRKALLRFTVRMWRQQRRFVQLFDAYGQTSNEETRRVDAFMKAQMYEVIHQHLGEPRNRLILRFLEEGPRCERLLSREFSMTRCRVRGEILNAVGIIIVHLADLAAWEEPDRQVAHEIWGKNHSPTEAAMQLRMPLAAIREAHRRNLLHLRNLVL